MFVEVAVHGLRDVYGVHGVVVGVRAVVALLDQRYRDSRQTAFDTLNNEANQNKITNFVMNSLASTRAQDR